MATATRSSSFQALRSILLFAFQFFTGSSYMPADSYLLWQIPQPQKLEFTQLNPTTPMYLNTQAGSLTGVLQALLAKSQLQETPVNCRWNIYQGTHS